MCNCFIKLFPSFKQQTCAVVVVLCSRAYSDTGCGSMIAEYTRASPDAVRVGAAPEMHFRHARLCHM